MKEEEDDGAFGSKKKRGQFIRGVWGLLFLENLLIVGGSLTGSFAEIIRDYAHKNFWLTVGYSASCLFVAAPFYYLLMVSYALRYNSPINFIITLIIFSMLGGAVTCISALIEHIWVVPIFTVSLEAMIFCVLVLSFVVDVSKWSVHLLCILFVGCLLIGLFLYLFLMNNINLVSVILIPLIYFIYTLGYSSQIIAILKITEELEIDEDDYFIGVALVVSSGFSNKTCCQKD